MHLNDNELRRNLDQELSTSEAALVQAHLSTCAVCQARHTAMVNHARLAANQIASLAPSGSTPTTGMAARRHLEARIQSTQQEEHPMSRLFARIPRSAWVGVAVVILLAVSLIFPPVRAAANSFLGLFRVQHIQVISVDQSVWSENMAASPALQTMFEENMRYEGFTETQVVSNPAEASALAGFTVRMPERLEDARLVVGPSGRMEITLRVDQVNDLFHEMGRDDLRLQRSLDGTNVSIEVLRGVSANWGNCEMPQGTNQDPDALLVMMRNCISLVQMPSPVVSAPDGLDLVRLGQIYLELLGMPGDEAARFAASIDWSSTLVIPMPEYQADYFQINVDGVKGTLIESRYGPDYVLMWVKDGIVYSLTGSGNSSEAVRIANSLK